MLLARALAAQIPAPGLTWPEAFPWVTLASTGGKILVVLLLGWASYRVLGVLLRRVEGSIQPAQPGTVSIQEQRVQTLLSLLRSVGIAFILLITLFMGLTAMGIQIGPLLAGAGVVGLAISFGSQSLVRDVISGLFILFENQFGVGDVVRLGEAAGRVEKMSLRIVVLRDVHGAVHIVPNGEIKLVTNLTRAFSRAVLDIGVAYREDVDRVMEVMRDEGRKMREEPDWNALITEEITVPGIESFGDSAVVIRIVATTIPLKQWDVARELRRRLKNRFDAEGIEIPFPHRTLFWGGSGERPREGEPSPFRDPLTAAG